MVWSVVASKSTLTCGADSTPAQHDLQVNSARASCYAVADTGPAQCRGTSRQGCTEQRAGGALHTGGASGGGEGACGGGGGGATAEAEQKRRAGT